MGEGVGWSIGRGGEEKGRFVTLILMRASQDYVTQAVDRLITYQNGGEFDPRSNKL